MKPHRVLIRRLSVFVVLMFGFSFALVPLYNVFCQVTGLNGKVDKAGPVQYRRQAPDLASRSVTVEFDVNRNQGLPCEIEPQHRALQVSVGELTSTSYYVKNLTNKRMIIQAIPSISPGILAKYLKKLECFCFEKQILAPHQTLALPLRFWLEPELPESTHRLTLSYTIFDVTAMQPE